MWIILVIVAGVILYLVRGILIPFIGGAALAYALLPIVRFAQRRGLTRIQGILVAYGILLGVLAVFGTLVVPGLAVEIHRLAGNVPIYITHIQAMLLDMQSYFETESLPTMATTALETGFDQLAANLEQMLTGLVRGTITGVVGLAGGLFNLILTPLLAAYFLVEVPRLRQNFSRLIPGEYAPRIMQIMAEVHEVLSGFIHGYLLVAIIIGLMSGTILAFLGVRFYLVLGVFAGLTNLIPYFGPFIGAIPAIGLGLLDSWGLGIQVAVAFLIIQQIESLLITPRILGGKTGLHPLAVVFAVMAGGSLYGVIGLLLAVPTAAIIKVLLGHLWDWVQSQD